ncbi:MAG: MCE family protein [Proteobacteria bacterium]|nr:MCE family protein [Pseudomonadota bacterium]MBU1650128.1 MCE family protein [Pseudomonadota bacterium]
MSKKANSTRIGAFVVLSFLLLVTGIVIFGGGKFFSNKNTAIVYFEGSLQGLNVGAPVAYRGITIGEVKEIQIDINADTFQIIVPVLISLDPTKIIKVEGRDKKETNHDINTFLKTMCDRGLRASLKSQSLLTGKLYIDLSIQEDSKAIYHDKGGKYLEIPTVPSEMQQMTQAMQSLNFQELAGKFSNTMDALEKMSTSLEQALNSKTSQEKLALFFTSLDRFHSILAKVDENLLPVINKFDTSLDKVSQLSDNTNQMIGHIDGQVEPFFTTMNSTTGDAGAALQAIETLMTNLEQSTGIDSPLHYQLTESIIELGKAAKSIRLFTESLDRNPQRLLFGTEQGEKSSK